MFDFRVSTFEFRVRISMSDVRYSSLAVRFPNFDFRVSRSKFDVRCFPSMPPVSADFRKTSYSLSLGPRQGLASYIVSFGISRLTSSSSVSPQSYRVTVTRKFVVCVGKLWTNVPRAVSSSVRPPARSLAASGHVNRTTLSRATPSS